MKLYKVLSLKGYACHGGSGKWDLPKNGKLGKWRTVCGPLLPCENGLHLCREQDLLEWLGTRIFEAEVPDDVEMITADNKVVVRKARLVREMAWDKRRARLFACDCASHVLKIYEQEYPDDKRPREAIRVARRFANGRATGKELDSARAAAWVAAENTARNRAAAWAAWATTENTARAAWVARAAWAARAAAWNAERAWQTRKLMRYLRGEIAREE